VHLKYAKGGELEPGNLNYSTVVCEADKGRGGIIKNVGDFGGRPCQVASLVAKGV